MLVPASFRALRADGMTRDESSFLGHLDFGTQVK